MLRPSDIPDQRGACRFHAEPQNRTHIYNNVVGNFIKKKAIAFSVFRFSSLPGESDKVPGEGVGWCNWVKSNLQGEEDEDQCTCHGQSERRGWEDDHRCYACPWVGAYRKARLRAIRRIAHNGLS